MSPGRGARLDPRAWLLWGAAASLPALVGRNPFVLSATLLAVLGVRAAWTAPETAGSGWAMLVRLALIFGAIGAIFNLLTVHIGDRVLLRIPAALPVVGGPITLNALAYGLLSGTAILVLVLVGTTFGTVLDGSALLRLLPGRMTTVAVAGSVAWAFVPQTAVAFGQIREAQAARGHRPRGARDLVPLIVPLVSGGLERAMTMAEALESRAFGASLGAEDAGSWPRRLTLTLGLTAGIVGAYLLAAGKARAAALTLGGAAICLVLALREGRQPAVRRTRYRSPCWGKPEALIAGSAGLALAGELVVLALAPSAFAYEPYPSFEIPRVHLPLLVAIALLMIPAFMAPPAADHAAPDERGTS